MSACPTLETENLILRPFKDEDTNDFFSMMDSREVREALHVPDDEGLPEAFHAMAAWPVSYTHLTLPTIYSV